MTLYIIKFSENFFWTAFLFTVCTLSADPSGRAVWVCGRSVAGIVGSNPAGGMDVLSLVGVVCCQVEVSASG
jgi:hypothetical protein